MTDDAFAIAALRRAHPDFVIGFTRVFGGRRVSAHRTDADAGGLYAVIGTPHEVETELACEQHREEACVMVRTEGESSRCAPS